MGDDHDRAAPGGAGDPTGRGAGSWPIVVAASAVLVVNLDTMLNIALPAITKAFAVEVSEIGWLVICYVLTYACLLVTTGRLADAYGHERMLRIGLAITVAGLTACGVTPNWGAFLAGRVLQGAGAALVLGAAPALVTISVPEQQRSRALGLFQFGVALGFVAGPPVGGLLLELTSWRAVFLVRAPLAAAMLVLVVLRPTGLSRPTRAERPPLDLAGTLSLGGAVAGGLLGLNRGGQTGWTGLPVLVGLAALPVLAVVWVTVERRAAAPALDPRLFRSPSFSVANLLSAAANAAMFMIWLLVPYYLLTTRSFSTITGGLLLAANPLATALVAPVAGRASARLGAGRVAVAGLAVEAAGLFALSRLGPATPAVGVAGALATVGLGVGLFTVPNMSLVMGAIARSEQGVAGALTQMARTIGVVGGVALGGIGLAHLRRDEAARLGVPATDPSTFLPAFGTVFLVAAIVAGAAMIVSLARAGDRDQPRPTD